MVKTSAYAARMPDKDGNIVYTADDDKVWADLFAAQMPNVKRCSAPPVLAGYSKLNLPADRVPQCNDVSETLRALTGWQVTPVPALIGFAQFFDLLAQRIFPAASFIRSRKDFDYIEEPDIFHEIFGHTPLLADPRFAEFSQAIGRAGQAADKSDYAWLIRLYWFSIEFGLTRVKGEIKALGSGLSSSRTELMYSVGSDVPQRRPFDVLDILRTPYRIDIHQPAYFVIEDLDDLFAVAERDLLADVARAKTLGLFAPLYPVIDKQAG
jgi:phenylalanine-4-hydroxylase